MRFPGMSLFRKVAINISGINIYLKKINLFNSHFLIPCLSCYFHKLVQGHKGQKCLKSRKNRRNETCLNRENTIKISDFDLFQAQKHFFMIF